jgi:hypothetical protein
MYLNGSVNYLIDFSFTEDDITFRNKSDLKNTTKDKEIVIPFDIDLGNIESRLKDVEDIKSTVNNIHTNNPYVGLDPQHVVSINQTNIPGNNDDTTFFEYYELLNGNKTTIALFGVVVKTKSYQDTGNMFWMDKGLGIIELGNSTVGSVNLIGKLYLTNDSEIAQVDCQYNQIIIRKTEDLKVGKNIIIPYGINITNLESRLTGLENESYTPIVPDTLNTYSNSSHVSENLGNDVLFQYYDTSVNIYTKQEDSDQYTPLLFEINKNDNSIQIGTTSDNIGNVSIGGESVELYTQNIFNMYLGEQSKYVIVFSFTEKEIIFNNNSDVNLDTKDKEIIIPFDTDLTNLETRLTTLENGSEEGLTIDKINDINPYFGIDKIETNPNDYTIPIHNNNLFEYNKITVGTQTKAFSVFISPRLSTGNNQTLFHIVKGESYNTLA